MAKRNTPKKELLRKSVESLVHDEASRKNIPTAEYQSVMQKEEQTPVRVTLQRDAAGLEGEKARRNRDLDPQLVWRGKDEQDWSDLVVQAPPVYIQEKVHPKVLIDDLLKRTDAGEKTAHDQINLFADFNGLPSDDAKTEFYQHDANWSNRMILGDSLQVMASLAEREGLRGKVQCIYFDPPYGIKFNSNFQWSTTSRDVKDGKADHITREPEQVKAFRDTWRDGIHSYLTYLRDRFTVARDLLTDSGSIFVQIGDENVHRVRAVMDEVFGEENFFSQITLKTTGGLGSSELKSVTDFIVWYAKSKEHQKFRKPLLVKRQGEGASTGERYDTAYEVETGAYRPLTKAEREDPSSISDDVRTFQYGDLVSSGFTPTCTFPQEFEGKIYSSSAGRSWKTNKVGIERLIKGGRVGSTGSSIRYRRFLLDYPAYEANNIWEDTVIRADKQYIVETSSSAIARCLLMATDPGDLVLDPTCGSGTTAFVAEQWGRRWITIDTSRVALALARARIMGARYPFYLLADSRPGQLKEAEVTRTVQDSQPVQGDIRHGFVNERVPHITLKSIANNAEIDVIWEHWQAKLEPLRKKLNDALKRTWQEWEIPRVAEDPWDRDTQRIFNELKAEQRLGEKGSSTKISKWLQSINYNLKRSYTLTNLPTRPVDPWPDGPAKLHADWWQARIARQQEIDKSIDSKAEFEYLYDKPYDDKKKVRVAGPFTVESLSPHRVLGVDENDELIDTIGESNNGDERIFVQMILENLKTAGVQQAHKDDKINFTSITPWPGYLVCAEGRYHEGDSDSGTEKRAAIFIGPEFGTVSRPDLVAAAREAGDANFDVLITCAFNYDAHSSEFNKLGRIPVLKARMNADLHMADDLKNTGKGNLFVIFGEPDIEILEAEGGKIKVKVNGVDVFHPNTGEVRSDGPDGIACWFVDTDYNEESFFVRHAYFLGANDPYKSLKTTLKAEINEEAWTTLNSDTSRPFDKPTSGRIAVKVINHLGDEVMKVFKVT
jgi:adenine-specific DNA-methyltransferase